MTRKYLIMAAARHGSKVLEMLGSKEDARKAIQQYKTQYAKEMPPLFIKRVPVR